MLKLNKSELWYYEKFLKIKERKRDLGLKLTTDKVTYCIKSVPVYIDAVLL